MSCGKTLKENINFATLRYHKKNDKITYGKGEDICKWQQTSIKHQNIQIARVIQPQKTNNLIKKWAEV